MGRIKILVFKVNIPKGIKIFQHSQECENINMVNLGVRNQYGFKEDSKILKEKADEKQLFGRKTS